MKICTGGRFHTWVTGDTNGSQTHASGHFQSDGGEKQQWIHHPLDQGSWSM